MFGLLDEDEDEVQVKENKKREHEKKKVNNKEVPLLTTTSQTEGDKDNSSWTDVSSTKSRRLAPQWSSSKTDTPTVAPSEPSKKKGGLLFC